MGSSWPAAPGMMGEGLHGRHMVRMVLCQGFNKQGTLAQEEHTHHPFLTSPPAVLATAGCNIKAPNPHPDLGKTDAENCEARYRDLKVPAQSHEELAASTFV